LGSADWKTAAYALGDSDAVRSCRLRALDEQRLLRSWEKTIKAWGSGQKMRSARLKGIAIARVSKSANESKVPCQCQCLQDDQGLGTGRQGNYNDSGHLTGWFANTSPYWVNLASSKIKIWQR